MSAPARPMAGIPPRFWWWLTGTGLSMLGVNLLGFAMAWVAAGDGGTLAGLVLTAINLPRTLLLLVGGALADRVGAWRVMIAGDGAMVLVTATFAVVLWQWGPRPGLLVAAALLIGTVDAFYLPASGSMPRRLLPAEQLTRGMSARQVVAQLGSVLGAPLGGVVVTALSLSAAAALNSVTFAVMFGLLLAIRPRSEPATAGASAGPGTAASAVAGLRLAVADRVLRPALLLLVGTAALLLPAMSLLLPVLARQQGWEATGAGLAAGVGAGAAAAGAILVMVHGGYRRPAVAAGAGLLLGAAGLVLLATARGGVLAVVAAGAVGLGTALFSTHLGPLVLGQTPPDHLARVQAVVGLAQSVPLLVANAALGALAEAVGAAAVLVGCAASLLALTAWAMLATPLRTVEQPGG